MIRRRVRRKPELTATTVSIPVSALAVGAQPANSFPGWISPATSTVVNDTRWGTTGKHLISGSNTTYMARTAGVSRDQEISFWGDTINVYLRLTDDGTAICFALNALFSQMGITVRRGLQEGIPKGENNAAIGFAGLVTSFFNVDQISLSAVPGFSSTSNTGHYWTIGCDGFDLYAKYNGVEFWRTKQFWHLAPGRMAIAANVGGGYRDVTATHKTNVQLFSDLPAKIFDIRDLGMKSLSAVGSMTAGSPTLTLTSNPGFSVGDRVCVATGGEAGGGVPGERGVGGQWPTLLYATIAARNSDTSQVVNKVCGVLADGLTYQWNGSSWIPYQGNLFRYLDKIVPKALVATVTNVAGNTLTLNTNAVVSTTNANVYFDNADIFTANYRPTQSGLTNQIGCTIYYPPGNWVFANKDMAYTFARDIKIVGSGKLTTTIVSPTGTVEAGLNINDCGAAQVRNIGFLGNTRTDKGYFFRFHATTDQFASAVDFVRMTSCPSALVENIRGVNYSQSVSTISYSVGATQRFIDAIHETGHKNYFQWAVNIADSINCVSEDIYFDSPWLFKGLESFRSTGSILRRATGRNTVFSSNSNSFLTIEDCSMVYEAGCGNPPWFTGVPPNDRNPSAAEPLVNLNSNIDNTSGSSSESSILIKNCDFDVRGEIWAGAGFDLISMSGTVNFVTLSGKYPAKPVATPSGRITLPNLGAGRTRALRSDAAGKTITIDGVRINGTYTQTPIGSFGGVIQAGTTIQNCVVDNLATGGTQTNNITNSQYEGESGYMLYVAGQSNASAEGTNAARTAPPGWVSDSNIKIWDGTAGAWATYTPGTNSMGQTATTGQGGFQQWWGPEIHFAMKWRLDNPTKTLYIVKHTFGGISLDPTSGSTNWHPSTSGSLYATLKTKSDNAKIALQAANLNPVPIAFIWMQGETPDGGNNTYSTNYATNLQSLITAVRTDMIGNSAVWLIGRNPMYASYGLFGTWKETRIAAAQAAIAASNPPALVVDTREEGALLDTDGYHYIPSSVRSIAERMYAGYLISTGFAEKLDAAPGSTVTSETVTIRNTLGGLLLSVSGGQWSKNGGAYTSASGTVINGDTVTLQATASASNEAVVTPSITVGNATLSKRILTLPAVGSGLDGSESDGTQLFTSNITDFVQDLSGDGYRSGSRWASWNKNRAIAPDGTLSAVEVRTSNAVVAAIAIQGIAGYKFLGNATRNTKTTPSTLSYYLKPAEYGCERYIVLAVCNQQIPAPALYLFVDTQTWTVSDTARNSQAATNNDSISASSITNARYGYKKISMTFTLTQDSVNNFTFLLFFAGMSVDATLAAASAAGRISGTFNWPLCDGFGNKGLYYWRPKLT